MAKVDDNFSVTINIRLLIQLATIFGSIIFAYTNLKSTQNELKLNVESLEKRLGVIEDSRNSELEEINKSLIEKVFKRSKE
jgi:hypothetical protein|tara:strand:- start:3733 stop:3975 length:243 start_codon:yes stop_codon:yes gene_type:complete